MGEDKIYIGTKVIRAVPMDEFSFIALKGEDPVLTRNGMENRSGYRVTYEDGYVSWSPKETFERAYREVTPAEKNLVEGR